MSDFIKKAIDEAKTGFLNNKGKGSIYLVPPVNVYLIAYSLIISIKNKTPTAKILVVVDKFDQRQVLLDCFNSLPKENKDYYFDSLTILSKRFINLKYTSTYKYHFILTIGLNAIEDLDYILTFEKISKFTLSIFTENTMNREFITKVREVLPDIVTNITAIEARKAIVSSPVEERRYGVSLSDEDTATYNKYNNYIKDSMSIFGDLDTVNKCRVGDPAKHLTAMDIRLQLAQANGWSYNIDTTVEFMKQIDDVYNPNAIGDRADIVYNIIRERRNLVLNNKAKIDKILEIVEHTDRLIIISKSGEFAHLITEAINERFGYGYCVDYHDAIPESYLKDENDNYICYKTGKRKGEPKVFKSQALSGVYLQYFNSGISKVLSIKNASNTDLKTACNEVILTSTLIDNIIELRNRFVNVNFGTNTIVHRVYCKNTIEETELMNEKPNHLITIKDSQEENISFDKNSGEIIL